jgi:cell division protein FtsN
MRNKETGEFELIVGNGQLVSGFFIVILLFAVGVAMGYILGQNSEKAAKTQPGDAVPCVATDGRPQASQPSEPARQPAQQPAQEAAASQPAPATDAQQPGAAEAPPQPTTQPAKEPEPAPAVATKPAQPEPAKPAPPSKSAAASTSSEPPSGSFWQVTAKANRESAQATLKILKERGFSAYLAPGPNNLTRVLVGPYKDTPSKAKAKTELEAMGFKPIKLDRE